MIKKIEYDYDEKTGNIVLPEGPPFDGNPVLIKFAEGWCEGWWDKGYAIEDSNGKDYRGWSWVCMDDKFEMELDDAQCWCELPEDRK